MIIIVSNIAIVISTKWKPLIIQRFLTKNYQGFIILKLLSYIFYWVGEPYIVDDSDELLEFSLLVAFESSGAFVE